MNEKEKTIDDAIVNAMILATSDQIAVETLTALTSLRNEHFRAIERRIEIDQIVKQLTNQL